MAAASIAPPLRVLFFTENNWVFGKIHNELIKFLLPAVDADILCWLRNYSHQDWQFLNEKYDLIVTAPGNCFLLHHEFGIPCSKLIGVAHGNWDIFDAIKHRGIAPEAFSQLAGYAVIAPLLVHLSFSHGIERVPAILPVGITQKNYTRPMSTEIRRLGYFGKTVRHESGIDIKRGHLAQQVADAAGLELVGYSDAHFLCADRFYSHVDLTIFCSLMEGNPYVALESLAAGVPVLGTPTGIFPELVAAGGGILLPFEADQFVSQAVQVIRRLQGQFDDYRTLHTQALVTGATRDWSVLAPAWITYFQQCLPKFTPPPQTEPPKLKKQFVAPPPLTLTQE